MRGVSARSAPGRYQKRWTRFILPGYTYLLILYLIVPIIMMILYGFNNIPGLRQTARFYGFTLQWYRRLFENSDLTSAVRLSVTVAIVAATVATPLGTLMGLALGRYWFRGRGAISFVIFMAIAVPEIVLGSSLLSMFVQLGRIPLGVTTILLAHIGFDTPFVAVTVRARVSGMDRSMEDAAKDLFATPLSAFFRVTLPIIAPGIMAGFMLAFVLSMDDFVVTQFVSGQTFTFPLWVYGASRIGIPPSVNVFGTILFLAGVSIALFGLLRGLLRKEQAAA